VPRRLAVAAPSEGRRSAVDRNAGSQIRRHRDPGITIGFPWAQSPVATRTRNLHTLFTVRGKEIALVFAAARTLRARIANSRYSHRP
jgi:hypothetical protein